MLATTPLRGLADFKSAETALLIAARAVLCCPLTATAQRNGVVAGKRSRRFNIRELASDGGEGNSILRR